MENITETTFLYDTQTVSSELPEGGMLRRAGAEGWELVAVVPNMLDGTEDSRTFYFKKAVTVTRRFAS